MLHINQPFHLTQTKPNYHLLLNLHPPPFTPQPQPTFPLLIHNQKHHLTPEHLYLKLKHKPPQIPFPTLYPTLQLLSQLTLLHKINFAHPVSPYHLPKHPANHFHHHLLS
ncbi:transcriptional repressor, partial [Staphylococcus auricularis]|uniref:transcriptional repressor n=1 Tax=Staphylococcus auricularis TaxID=29379 RepID=UPI00384BAAF5